MANVNIKFNNKEYLLSCDEGQEENLKELADYLDSKYNNLKKKLGNIGEVSLSYLSTSPSTSEGSVDSVGGSEKAFLSVLSTWVAARDYEYYVD